VGEMLVNRQDVRVEDSDSVRDLLRERKRSRVIRNTVQHVQHSTVQYSTIQHSTGNTVRHSAVQHTQSSHSTVRSSHLNP
jgi:hypothetical protein